MNERQPYQRNQLNHLFLLRHPRRFWFASLTVALVSAIVLGPWLESAPWLVSIPLVAGGLLVALGELLDELCGKAALQAADKSSVPGQKL